MKIKDGFVLRKVSDAYVVVATGKAALEFNGMITLNSTGAFLWQELEKGCLDKSELVDRLLAEYDVERSLAERDVDGFVSRIADAQIIEE